MDTKVKNSDYVFKEINGNLEFVGDFDSLYKNEDDPWNQSAKNGEISNYHLHSRKRLTNQLKNIDCVSSKYPAYSIFEIGCGLGYTTNDIQRSLSTAKVTGADISSVAITKAQKLFPNLNFVQANICDSNFSFEKKQDIVILNQLLWYILECFPVSLKNCFDLLKKDGKLVFSQGFLQSKQKYAAEICDGFDGLVGYLNKNANKLFKIEYSDFDNSKLFVHDDGLLILNKI